MTKRASLFALVAISGLTAAGNCFGQQTSEAAGSDVHLKQFLQSYLTDPNFGQDKSTRFSSVQIALSDKAAKEIIVYVTGRDWCGSGGCLMLVLTPEGSSFSVIGRTTIVHTPIRVLDSKTNGWHDIAAWVQGGGVQPGYEAELSFDGKAYPRNPSVPPAHKVVGSKKGETLALSSGGLPLY